MIFTLIGTKIWIKNITKKLKYVFSIFSCFVFLKNHRLDNFFWYRQGLHAWLNVACNQCKIQDNDHSLSISNLFSCYCASNPCEISGFANVWKFVHSRIGHIWIFLFLMAQIHFSHYLGNFQNIYRLNEQYYFLASCRISMRNNNIPYARHLNPGLSSRAVKITDS